MFFVSSVNCQVVFTSRPSSLQLYQRQTNDSASVSISGKVVSNGYTKAIYTLRKNGVVIDSSIVNISYSSGSANFSKSYKIPAEKSFFLFAMYIFNGTPLRILSADSVCAGDVFLVNGQSNAVALANTTVSDTASVWVRSFGSRSPSSVECLNDTLWGIANAGTGNLHCGIGVWAYRLGKLISDSTGIPVCFINGGKIGSRIIDHLPFINHADINSIYGRLLYRAQKAKVTTSIKAIFWYQGESDVDTASLQYANRFNQLYFGWKQDFPGLSKIFVLQLRPGCMSGTTSQYHQQLRETLRNLPLTYNDVSLMTTTAIPNYDGCHFFVSGYNILAQQLYNQLVASLYNKPVLTGINPPRIIKALYTNYSNTELSLVFDQPLNWPSLFNGYNLRDYFYLNCNSTITNGYAVGDTIKLQLSSSTNADKISYLPGIYYNGTQNTYMGPWITNNKSVGVPSFYQFPISNKLAITASTCTTTAPVISTTRSGQNYQWLLNGNIITNANNYQYTAVADGIYTLIMTDSGSFSITSNAISIMNGKRTPLITTLNAQNNYCDGGSIKLSCDVTANNFQWYKNGAAILNANSADYSASSNGNYSVMAQFTSTCNATSLPIAISKAPSLSASISITNQFDFCKDSLATLTANSGIGLAYQWQRNNNNISGATNKVFNTFNIGTYKVIITNNFGCTKSSSSKVIPAVNPTATITASKFEICPEDTVILTANSGIGFTYLWFKNNAIISGYTLQNYYATSASSYGVRVTNNMGCSTSSSALVIKTNNECVNTKQIVTFDFDNLEFIVYPNPFNEELVLQSHSLQEHTNLNFELFNIQMKKIVALENISITEGEEIYISTEHLPSGIYYFRLINNDVFKTGKIIKQ